MHCLLFYILNLQTSLFLSFAARTKQPLNHQSTKSLSSLVIPHCTFNSSNNVITMLPSPLPSQAIFFFFRNYVWEWEQRLSKCPQQQQRIQSRYGGRAAVQSRLAGYLMSLVIGLLLPPRIPALLLLMCAGTERERESYGLCSLPHVVFPSLTQPINLFLYPSLFHKLI